MNVLCSVPAWQPLHQAVDFQQTSPKGPCSARTPSAAHHPARIPWIHPTSIAGKKEAKKDCPGLNLWMRSWDLPKVEQWLKVITPLWREGCRRYSYQLANSFTEPVIHHRHSPRFLSHRKSGLGMQKKEFVAAVLNRLTSRSHPRAFFSYSLLIIYFLVCAAHTKGHPVTFGSKLPTSCIQQSCGQCPKFPKFCSF